MDSSDGPPIDAATVARQLAASLRQRGQDYALSSSKFEESRREVI